ncbi:peptidase T [Pedobacter psychrophilus]|uniref:Peptidase T n=1 Tax=Pedobacter psychrophilus TaxID=1826909 RepID=A0A179DHJ2_9SPHI|nr:peptidase T [Pedobacter psychrophilus]OAQ40364.1 peptidase T [Pedobacter psychrophilus]
MKFNYTVLQRFISYVKIDTQSDGNSKNVPSTEKQKDLSKVLVSELLKMGVSDAHLDDKGYVYATIPSNSEKKVPIICFCSHVDTSPDCSGANVKPIIHKNYQGEDLVLPDDDSIVLKLSEHPDLINQIGNNIITASGTTLLGADNKAGVAEIMDAAYQLINNPEIKHGEIKILFTPDEEIGRGVDHVDIKKLNADFGYTIDGETLGSYEDETFSADGMQILIKGVSAHPGFAKGKMQSAIKIASKIIAALPKNRLSPESTHQKEGFVHPVNIQGQVENAEIDLIIRDFEDEKLKVYEDEVKNIALKILENYPGATLEFQITVQYRNMKKVIDKYPKITEYALKAIERSGIKPLKRSIRGGTDGSRLSFMGLPCPNIFAGEHAFHGKQEWVSEQDMQAAVRTIINLAMIWEEEA